MSHGVIQSYLSIHSILLDDLQDMTRLESAIQADNEELARIEQRIIERRQRYGLLRKKIKPFKIALNSLHEIVSDIDKLNLDANQPLPQSYYHHSGERK